MPDFQRDLYEIVSRTLDVYHVEYKRKDTLFDLAVRLYTFHEKYIPLQKRKVLISKELTESLNSFPKSVQIALNKLTEWIKDGVDINCFQSRGLYGKGSRDYQHMLYCVNHLHLSAKKDDDNPRIKKDGFAKAGKYLLYAYFNESNAYFIKALKHPEAFDKDKNIAIEWISKDILAIVVHNWPELLHEKKIENMTPCDSEGNPIDIDDKTISVLSTNNINTPFNLGNHLCKMGWGMTASGESMSAVFQANRLLNDTTRAQIMFEKNKENICMNFKFTLEKARRPVPMAFDIHYEYIELELTNYFLIVDRNSGVFYDYNKNKYGILRKRVPAAN